MLWNGFFLGGSLFDNSTKDMPFFKEEIFGSVRSPARCRYYFRTNPLFETGAKQYGWLNDIVCVGQGYLIEAGLLTRISRSTEDDVQKHAAARIWREVYRDLEYLWNIQ